MLFRPCSIFARFRVTSSVFPGKWKKGTSALMNGIRGRARRFSGRPTSCNDPVGPTTSTKQTHTWQVMFSRGFQEEEMRLLYTKGNEDKGIYRRDRVDGWEGGGEKGSRGHSLFERQRPLGSLPGVTGERLSIPSKGTTSAHGI